MTASRWGVLFIWLIGLTTLGCSPSAQPTESDPRGHEMFAVGRAFHRFCQERGRPPEGPEDLVGHFAETSAARTAQQRLMVGEFVFFYGVSQTDMQRQAGTSATVLAYERQVPREGGWVLMGDSGVKKMTAREFAESPKAKQLASGGRCDTSLTPPASTLTRPKLDP